jgi:hypothetical protein
MPAVVTGRLVLQRFDIQWVVGVLIPAIPEYTEACTKENLKTLLFINQGI